VRPSWTLPRGAWDVAHFEQQGLYFHLVEVNDVVTGTARVRVEDRGAMLMFGGTSYLGLIGHPAIDAAARANVLTRGGRALGIL
jgi:hypothetical protein